MPVTMTGPDGKTYRFPEGTDQDKANAYFQKKGIGQTTGISLPPTATIGPAPGGPLNWLQNLQSDIESGGGLTLPGRVLQKMGAPGTHTGGSAGAADILPGSGTIRGGLRALHGVGETIAGHPIKGINEAVSGTGEMLAPAMLAFPEAMMPSVGRMALGTIGGAGAEQLAGATGADKDTKEFIGNLVGGLLTMQPNVPSSKRLNKLNFAAGGRSIQQIQQTAQDLFRSAGNKVISTVGDFLTVVKNAKDAMNQQSGQAMIPIWNRQANSSPIAQHIRSLITPNMQMTAEGRAAAKRIDNAALEFDKPGWTYGKLDQERMKRNADLASFYKGTPLARYTKTKGDADVAIDKAVADAIRNVTYPEMDRALGRPVGYFQALKDRQGSLIDLESSLNGHIEKLKNKTSEIQGAPRFGRENISMHTTSSGRPGFSLYGLTNVISKPNPMKTANRAVEKGFRPAAPMGEQLLKTLPVETLLDSLRREQPNQ